MKREFHVERITDPKDTRLEYVYRELLHPYFLPEEIDPIERTRTFIENANNGTAKNPIVLMVAYHPNDENPASLVNGHIIKGKRKSFGAIGYIATKEEYRRQGLGSSLVNAFEEQLLKHNKNPKLVLLERKKGSFKFWKEKGYGNVKDGRRNIVYYQPPIEFDPETGEPIYEKVRETLVAKLLDGENNNIENLRIWLGEGIEGMSRVWYMPKREKFKTEEAYRNAVKCAKKEVQANVDSIRNSDKLKIESFSRLA